MLKAKQELRTLKLVYADRSNTSSHRDLKLVVMVLIAGTILFHLRFAQSGVGPARDQHLGTAILYAKGSIDLFRPIIIGANANGVPTPLEFPVWQALTAILMKMFGTWYGWGNVVSLLFHVSTCWPIFLLAKGLFSARIGWWAVVLYAAQPLTFMWGGMAGADGMSASFAIWFVYLAWRMMNGGGWWWWLPGVIVGCLSATTKAPFFFVAGLTSFLWLLREHRRCGRAWLQLTSVGVVSVGAFVLWNHYANVYYEAAELPYCDLRIGQGGSIVAWWFGDLSSRLNVKSWIRGAWRAANVLCGSLVLVVLPLMGWTLRGSVQLKLWLTAGMTVVLVFTNLILIHWHYYYIFSAPVALLAARVIAEWEFSWTRLTFWSAWARAAVFTVAAVASLVQGLYVAHINLTVDRYPLECAMVIQQHTLPTDKLVVWNGGWSVPLLRAERNGLNILTWEAVTDSAKLNRLKELGYNRLVLMNTPPLLAAINASSGDADFKVKHLPDELPAVAREWNVAFSSASVLILEIPE